MNPNTEHRQLRSQAANIALFTALGLTILKFVAAHMSGSVGVLSEAVHSLLDLVSAAVAFFAVRHASRPADESHPFGHGKFETLSSLLEAILLIVAAIYIFWEGIQRLFHPQPLEHSGVAIAVISVSMVASFFVYRHNISAADRTHSPAIRVNALHYLADVASSAAVLVGLILIQLTGWHVLDSFIAFAIGAYITAVTLKEIGHAFSDLTDAKLPAAEVAMIEGAIAKHQSPETGFLRTHHLRTRRGGSARHIDFHMVMCEKMSVGDSHHLCDSIETDIQGQFPHATVSIHVEPCSHVEDWEQGGLQCAKICQRDGKPRKGRSV